MKRLEIKTNPEVQRVFNSYPDFVLKKMVNLRRIVIEAAEELPQITKLEETLKWGEPSYLTKHGSTIRMDWKKKSPEQFAIYFKCTSLLVPTFKKVFKDKFNYEGNRAIVFQITDIIPETELKHCISMALRYHKIKHLSLLGF